MVIYHTDLIGNRSPGTRSVVCELNLGSLQKQLVLLTSELSLTPQELCLLNF